MGEATAEESGTARTLADLMAAYARKPLKFEPDSKWAYCQSGINTAARIVEIVSGQPFHEFLEKRLFGPLHMKDTTFYLSEAQLVRLAKSYKKNKEGKLEETAISILRGRTPTDRNRYPAANGGLLWTYGGRWLYGKGGYSPYLKFAYDGKGTLHFVATEDHPRNYI